MIVEHELPNGITVVIESVPNVRSAALGIYVACGSAYENQNNNGISHMIEHMMFKGTKTRSARELAHETALLGDDMNAYTSKELTCYYARVLDEHLPHLIELFGDMFTNSLFAEEDLEREKSVILDEIDMYDDSPEDLVQEQLQKLVWKEHPLGYIISGTKENVIRISREELMEFWKKYYTAENIIISVAGNVNPDSILPLLSQAFGEIPHIQDRQEDRSVPDYVPAVKLFHKDTELTHICLGYPGIAHSDPWNYTFAIANNIIGGSSCSRLFQKVREEQGLCYSIYSFDSFYKNTGTIQVYTAMSEENVQAVYEGILDVLEEVRRNGVTKEEITQTISQIRSELLLSRENTHNRMNNNARNLIFKGRIISVEETMQGLEQVTNEDIIEFVNQYMNPELMSVVAAGNTEENPDLDKYIKDLRKNAI